METNQSSTVQKEWEQKLSQTGSRITSPRRAILKVIASSSHPLTPIEIFDQARKFEPRLGLVTVYRTIEKLEALHLVNRIHDHGHCQTIFRSSNGHQHLLTCTNCGACVYFDAPASESQYQKIGLENGFRISGHWLQLYGLCKICQNKKRTSND